jgi:hypothetical protein
VWFWAAFLISSLTPGMSAVQLQRQLGLTRYETAFQILHKLRSGMVRTSGRIGLRTRDSRLYRCRRASNRLIRDGCRRASKRQ